MVSRKQRKMKKRGGDTKKRGREESITPTTFSDVPVKPFIKKMFKTVPETMLKSQKALENQLHQQQKNINTEKTKEGLGYSTDEIDELQKEFSKKTSIASSGGRRKTIKRVSTKKRN